MMRTIASNLLLKSSKIYPKMGTADTADVGEVFLVAEVGFAQKHTLRKTI
jgi:hypothetical protein|tara:strand:+ start:52 stop:201 length:150 start_codon:yes stop_codon:yes gene_type:complete